MELTTWYLEMRDPDELKAASAPAVPVDIVWSELASPAYSRFLYSAVGERWAWIDRLPWDREQWCEYLDLPGVETWTAFVRGTPVGYAELDGHRSGEVELVYFGLMPEFIGQGIGGHLLTAAVERAWKIADRWEELDAPERVWLHTCSKDSPMGLANYRARGFTVYKTETAETDDPA
ncbi:GNAT family N-acetyltransferase [Glycomyces buryatensis]|uniref:GNAT family N-acetyltransferase n=1 Tax=Glycomyces buryatensis TaxID=2570927 RepID=A0A4S8QD99_9ACTN|nr:GNAT family N-acetyltransferase [Glycomyces buryatensis]THV42513.1 GNAT family N-acetyltransferase [Glycomyces buryatensis]